MKKYTFAFFLLSLVTLASCNPNITPVNTQFVTSNLKPSYYTIDVTRDTEVHAEKGALIKITKGSISGNKPVKLAVKEAYTLNDIIAGGIITKCNGMPLSTGGVIDIEPADGVAKIIQPISVTIPAGSVKEGMQLYRGKPDPQGVVNWIDPSPLGSVQDINKGCEFKMDEFGWASLAVFIEKIPGFEKSKLTVKITNRDRKLLNVFLVIPNEKIFADGGTANGSTEEYAFFTDDGKIPLPKNEKCYALALYEDGGQLLFGYTSFTSALRVQPELKLEPATKEHINEVIAGIDSLK